MNLLKLTSPANLQRYHIEPGEWLEVPAGSVAVLDAVAVLVVDGVLRLSGVLKVA